MAKNIYKKRKKKKKRVDGEGEIRKGERGKGERMRGTGCLLLLEWFFFYNIYIND
jgi:hypothetical protein